MNQIPVKAVIPDFLTTDSWVAGADNSKIEYVDFFAKYNVMPYTFLSDSELQNRGFETWGCVPFSGLNVVEASSNIKTKYGLLRESSVKWAKEKGYFNENRLWNFSDRYNFILAGVVKGQGTSGDNIAESIRKFHGVIPDKMLPWNGNNWDEYADPKVITQEMKDLGQEFLKRFKIMHDWVVTPFMSIEERVERLEYYSKHLPLQIFTPVCSGWYGSGVINACMSETPEHATVYCWKKIASNLIHDQYNPDFKELAEKYPILWAKRYDIVDNPDFVVNPETGQELPNYPKDAPKPPLTNEWYLVKLWHRLLVIILSIILHKNENNKRPTE